MLYLVLTVLVTEAGVYLRGNYRAKSNRLFGNIVFFASAIAIGLPGAGLMVGGVFADRQFLALV